DPAIAGTRLVLMTSLSHQDEAAIRAAGIAIRLTKPVKQSHLRDSLARLLASDVTATAPLTPPQPRDSAVAARVAEPAVANVQPARLLVVEDNTVNLKLAVLTLRKLGYAADSVTNGLEAVEAIERSPYDLVLMDCQMPVMDGY